MSVLSRNMAPQLWAIAGAGYGCLGLGSDAQDKLSRGARGVGLLMLKNPYALGCWGELAEGINFCKSYRGIQKRVPCGQ